MSVCLSAVFRTVNLDVEMFFSIFVTLSPSPNYSCIRARRQRETKIYLKVKQF